MTGCIPSLCTLLRAPATVMFGLSFMKPVIAVYLVSSSVGGITIYDHLLQEFFSLRFGFFFPPAATSYLANFPMVNIQAS